MAVTFNLGTAGHLDAGPGGMLVLDAAPLSSHVLVPNGDWLLHAEFARHGGDLQLTGADGAQVLVRDYFNHAQSPSLTTEDGAVIDGDLAARLAGPLAPGQYAQAGGGGGTLQAVGAVANVTGAVEARHPDGTTAILQKGDPVHLGDVLRTAGDGKVGITFDDGSVFSMNTNGRMTIDEFVYDAQAGKGSEVVSVVTGAFSFTSGLVAKTAPDAMTIKTPVATIGIRGTTGAGVAGEEGQRNTFTLLPDPDGSKGQFAVTTKAGTQVLTDVGATTQITSAFAPPPAPVILSPQQIQQQYGTVLQALPPPPTQQQLQQQIQQRSEGPAEKAVQEAKATAAEKAATEKAATEKAAAADKALGEKLATDKADMAKLAAEKMIAEGIKEGAVLKAAVGAKIGEVLTDLLGPALGQFGPQGPVDPTKLGPLGLLGPGEFGPLGPGEFGPLGPGEFGPLGPLGPGEFGPLGPGGFDLAAMINLVGQQVGTFGNAYVQQTVSNYQNIASSQPTTFHDLTTGNLTVGFSSTNFSAGVNDVIVSPTGNYNHIVTVTTALGVGDGWSDSSTSDTDQLVVQSGPNVLFVNNVETVNLLDATGSTELLIKNAGSTAITLATTYGNYKEAVGADDDADAQTWTITGNLGAGSVSDFISMGAGTDTLELAAATHSVTLSGVEYLNIAAGGSTLTFGAPVTGITVSVAAGAGADTLNLGGSAGLTNTLSISGIEIVHGSSSATDVLTLSSASSVVITNIDTLIGHSGVDTINGGAGNGTIIGGGGADTISGGVAANVFRYEVTTGNGTGDIINDFSIGAADKFQFLSTAFNGSLSGATLDASNFVSNTSGAAADSNDYFVFDSDDRVLYYDSDGNGAGGAVTIATVQAGGSVAATDIEIVNI